jgi:hypothetical protein
VSILGFEIQGRLTSASATGTYTLRIKNFDWTGGLAASLNLGEAVTISDFNGVASAVGGVQSPFSYWMDFDSNGEVDVADLNMLAYHLSHNCGFPQSP